MQRKKKKFIIFEDLEVGDLSFVKFLDEENTKAIFYNPLIGPKHLNNYLLENQIKTAYEVTKQEDIIDYQGMVHTFTDDNGVYDVFKGIIIDKKYVLMLDNVMDINLDLPLYEYTVSNGNMHIKLANKKRNSKNYCYVGYEEDFNSNLRAIIVPVWEMTENVLSFNKPKISNPIIKKSR